MKTNISKGGQEYTIQARLNVSLPGLDREVAQSLVDTAH
jgi:osmotically inducible protein OsmC